MNWFLKLWVALCLICFSAFSVASDEGYTRLAREWPVRDSSKIEVQVFFAYTCGYCYTFASSQLYDWEVPADVDYQEVPLNFSNTQHLSRAYHAAVALGVNKTLHPALFDAFLNKRRRFKSVEELASFASRYGVTEEQFLSAYNSFGVNVAMNRSDTLAKNYQIGSVPAVVVNGKYLTSPSLAGGHAEALQVIEKLIRQERALRSRYTVIFGQCV